jgi:single-stranded DNA-binding protein
MRSLASGKSVTQFAVATNEYIGNGKEKAEYHNVVTWDRLAEICGQYLGKGQQVAVEGRIQTRSWDDDRGQHQCQVRPTTPPLSRRPSTSTRGEVYRPSGSGLVRLTTQSWICLSADSKFSSEPGSLGSAILSRSSSVDAK